MNLRKPEPIAFHLAILLLAPGVAFSAIIWIIDIFWGVMGTPPSNYYISMPYAGLSYIQLCVFIFSGFMILGLILLLCGPRKIFALGLILSCMAIGTSTLLMKACLRKGHLMSMQGLVQGLQMFDPNDSEGPWYEYSYMVLFNHEAINRDLARWNEVENEEFEPAVEIVSVDGDWVLETGDYPGVCRFKCVGSVHWDIEFHLEINGDVWAEAEYLPAKIKKEDGRYKILLWSGVLRTADFVYDDGASDLVSSIPRGVYLEMSPDKQSFFMYPDETKQGLSLGPFVRQ